LRITGLNFYTFAKDRTIVDSSLKLNYSEFAAIKETMLNQTFSSSIFIPEQTCAKLDTYEGLSCSRLEC
jgi:hypothetical protein